MSVICAACQQPIEQGKFVIAGSEVIHKACVGRETVSWRLRRRIAAAEKTLAECERQMPELRLGMQQCLDEARRLRRDLDNRDSLLVGVEQRAQAAENRCRTLERHSAELRDERELHAQTRQQLTGLTQENARLAAALEAAQRPLREAGPTEQRVSTPEPLDDIAMRFSLLELD